MRHRVAGRKLGRSGSHRQALLRNLSTALFERERITTTLAKAKELRSFAERLVTLSKRETLHARRRILRHVQNPKVAAKLMDTLSARFAQRNGGYTRILKLGPRRGDRAEMAVIELVEAETVAPAEEAEGAEAAKGKKKKTAKTTKSTKKKSKPSKKAATKKAGAGSKEAAKAEGDEAASRKKTSRREAASSKATRAKRSTKKAGRRSSKKASDR